MPSKLPSWAYDAETAEAQLDPDLIENQGQFLLHRALNTRKLITFVGSGVSAAFGRVTWTELATTHVAQMLVALQNLAPGDSSQPEDPRYRILKQLEDLQKRPSELSAKVILALQLCEQIWRLSPLTERRPGSKDTLAHLSRAFGIEQTYKREVLKNKASLGRTLFRHWVKKETHDEIPHVARLLVGDPANARIAKLTKHVGHLSELVEDSTLHRSSADNPRRAFLQVFQPKTLKTLHSRIKGRHSARDPSQATALKILALATVAAEKGELTPVRRFIVGLSLDLARISTPTNKPDPVQLLLESAKRTPRTKLDRSETIAPRFDPLHRMAFDLQLTRFATTNYDLEIERLFHDAGFRSDLNAPDAENSKVGETTRVGPLGARSRDIVLTEESAADLIDFASDDGRYAMELVHLHGRSTDDSEIVITERDYQNTYLRDTIGQQTFREGLDIAFGGNPILFVGFGMSEGDILRPLREFVISSSRRNRSLVCLRDATDEKLKRDSFATEQYTRYGVHIVHFGFQTDLEGNRLQPVRDGDPSWLCRVLAKIRALQDLLTEPGATTMDRAARNDWRGRLTEFFNERSFPQTVWGNSFDPDSLPEEMTSDGGACDIRLEISTLEHLQALVLRYASPYRRPRKAVFEVVRLALERIKAALLTAALNAKLEGTHVAWKKWRHDWQLMIGDRGEFMRYRQTNLHAAVWGRHYPNRPEDAKHKPASFKYTDWIPATPHDRRCLVLMAPKGGGKGHLYSYLATTTEVSEQHGDNYIGQFFHNFSFGTEVASVWDAVSLFLRDPKYFPSLREQLKQPQLGGTQGWGIESFVPRSRLERLEWSLALATERARRVLLAFHAAEVLFDPAGRPKNVEIQGVLETLLARRHQQAPLDLIFTFRDTRLPQIFRLAQSGQDFTPIPLRLLVSEDALRANARSAIETAQDIASAVSRSGVALRGKPPSGHRLVEALLAEPSFCKADLDDRNFLYVLPRPKAQDFAEVGARLASQQTLSALRNAIQEEMPCSDAQREDQLDRFLRDCLGSNSYAFSLVLAAARRSTVITDNHHNGIHKLIRSIYLESGGLGRPPSDRTYELILDWFNWRPEPARTAAAVKKSGRVALPEADDPILLETLIRHIAIISGPVEAEVLAECPDVLNRLEKLRPKRTEELLRQALTTLYDRRLIVRIEEHEPPSATAKRRASKDESYRYQVHRSIQAHVFRKLGAQNFEPSEGFLFAPSLYAAQTRDLPKLHIDSYRFLYELVDNLIAYPARSPDQQEQVHSRDLARHGMCLRAALGVVRALFSLGVVTRFSEANILPFPQPPQIGYLEHHRLCIRWMLRLAAWIEEERSKERSRQYAEMWPPFYRDETVWLFNECGVFSLAQGQCYDAKALFDHALKLQREIEGPTGPMRHRILLNDAICSIDRGRLQTARTSLSEIATHSEDPLLSCISGGYLAVTEHLSGRVAAAMTGYDRAIEVLQSIKSIRPLAMLLDHRADLHRRTGDLEAAGRDYRTALEHAEAGGYADLVHYVRIGQARARLRERWTAASVQEAMKHLKEAEDYADRMDIPRLKCEALLRRCEVQVDQGDTTLAGQLVTQAIRVANLNGLALRKISGLLLLSKVLETRGNSDVASRVRNRAIVSARDIGYHSIITPAEATTS